MSKMHVYLDCPFSALDHAYICPRVRGLEFELYCMVSSLSMEKDTTTRIVYNSYV